MKALLITYIGEFHSDTIKREVVRSIAETLIQNANCDPKSIEIVSFDETDLLDALMKKSSEVDSPEPSKIDAFTHNFLKACKKVRHYANVENPDVFDSLALKRGLTYALINNQFDEDETKALNAIMKMNFNLKQNAKFKEILRDLHLEDLPKELKVINEFIDIV